jgi:protein tyrosine phosphatase
LNKFRRNAALFSRSRKERKGLRQLCRSLKIPAKLPGCPGETRWDSFWTMIKAFLEIEKGICHFNMLSEKMEELTRQDWNNAKGFFDVISAYQSAKKIEESEKQQVSASVRQTMLRSNITN